MDPIENLILRISQEDWKGETLTRVISYYAMAKSDQMEQLNLAMCGGVGRLPLYGIDDMKR